MLNFRGHVQQDILCNNLQLFLNLIIAFEQSKGFISPLESNVFDIFHIIPTNELIILRWIPKFFWPGARTVKKFIIYEFFSRGKSGKMYTLCLT